MANLTPDVLPILQVPDPRLRLVAAGVVDVAAPEVIQAIASLRATAKTLRFGGGLAAPQLGISLRIIYIGKETLGHDVLINPVFKPTSSEKLRGVEACYSVDDANQEVRLSRYAQGHLLATLPNGRRIKKHVRGFAARIVQHEIDHLDGITIDMVGAVL